MGKMALGEVVKGRNDKGARWHWANQQRVNWQKGEMVSGQKDDWARWQNGKGRNGYWARWQRVKWDEKLGEMGLGKLERHPPGHIMTANK